MRHYQVYQQMHNGSPKRRGERESGRKYIWGNNGQILPKFEEIHESTSQRRWTNSKKVKLKEIPHQDT